MFSEPRCRLGETVISLPTYLVEVMDKYSAEFTGLYTRFRSGGDIPNPNRGSGVGAQGCSE